MRIISSKQRDAIARFFQDIQTQVREAFLRDGMCTPVAFFMCDEGNAIAPLYEIMHDKDATVKVLNQFIEKTRPLAFVLVAESWVAKSIHQTESIEAGQHDLEDKYQEGLTESSPEGTRIPKPGVMEAVMLQCSAVTGENFMSLAEIVRLGDHPTLKPWDRWDNRQSTGRFIFDVVPLAERQ
jgi:hypothetical protein